MPHVSLDAAIYDVDEQTLGSMRVGNVAHVAFLRDFATRSLGPQSLVVSKVLYDGTHCGDSISVADLEPLSRELELLERAPDTDVRSFASDMLRLVRSALRYNAPIYFT